MKTKKVTKILMGSMALLAIAGSLKAQFVQDPLHDTTHTNKTSAVSGITIGGAPWTQPKNGFWGYAFGDYAFAAHGDSAGRGTINQYKGIDSKAKGNPGQNQNAVEIRRAYLGYDYTINSKFSGTALLAYEGDADVNGKRTIYVKYAYFTWANIFKGTNLKIGVQPTNSWATAYGTEPLEDYRASERTILDLHGIDNSFDMGAMLEGRIATFKNSDATKLPTIIGYSAMVSDNDAGPVPDFTASSLYPLNNSTDKAKRFRLNGYVNTLNGALTMGFYGDIINYGNVPYAGSNGTFQDASYITKVYASFNTFPFVFGFEAFQQTNTNGETEIWKPGTGTNDTTNATQAGISIWASATLLKNKLRIFARTDFYNPDTKFKYNANETFNSRIYGAATDAFAQYGYKENFINAGLDWTPTKDLRVHFMPNIWYDGISTGYGSGALRSDYYLIYRLTFLYVFGNHP